MSAVENQNISIRIPGRILPGGQETYLGPEVSDYELSILHSLSMGETRILPYSITHLWNLVDWNVFDTPYHEKEEINADVCYLNLDCPKKLERRFAAFFWRDNVDDIEGMLVVPLKYVKRRDQEWFRVQQSQLLVTWENTNHLHGNVSIRNINIFKADPVNFQSWAQDDFKDADWIGDLLDEIADGYLDQVIDQITIEKRTYAWPVLLQSTTRGKKVFG